MSDRLASGGTRVLVADDDPTIVLLLEHALQGLGRSYDTADDGAEAWSAWERDRHELVVLDIEMPKLDGLEVCRRIRAADAGRKTFVLIVTGRDKAVDLEAALDAGADDYVTKPMTGPRLMARLRIAQRRMADEAARRKAEDDLGRAKYMAGIGETSITLQHEINNPLTGLLATAELMLIEANDRGQPTAEIKTIIDQGRRIAALVKRMSELNDPTSVAYAGRAKMLDLKKQS